MPARAAKAPAWSAFRLFSLDFGAISGFLAVGNITDALALRGFSGHSRTMKRIIAAFFNSMSGLKFGLMREPALRQELALLAISIPAAPLLTWHPWKLLALWGSLVMLLALEFLNTGIEKLADRVTLDDDDLVKIAKDCGSAGVLMAIAIAGMAWGLALLERITG